MYEMKKLNILFLGGAKRVSLAEKFIEGGEKMGMKVGIFSYELDENVPISFIGKIIIGRKWADRDILEHLEDVVASEKIDIILPSVDPATVVASKFKNFTKSKCFIPVPDTNLCDIFFNKQLTYNWCISNGIPVPSDTLNFPMIAKPINGSASIGLIILKDEQEFKEFKSSSILENYNIQKFIDGIEYSVDVYVSCINHKMIVAVPRIRLEVLGGEAVKSITMKDNKLIALCERIVLKSGLTGPLVIQFIRDKVTQEDFLMEVNPRFGGAVLCSIGAGADMIGLLLNDFLGIESEPQNNLWKDKHLMIRRFIEYYRELN